MVGCQGSWRRAIRKELSILKNRSVLLRENSDHQAGVRWTLAAISFLGTSILSPLYFLAALSMISCSHVQGFLRIVDGYEGSVLGHPGETLISSHGLCNSSSIDKFSSCVLARNKTAMRGRQWMALEFIYRQWKINYCWVSLISSIIFKIWALERNHQKHQSRLCKIWQSTKFEWMSVVVCVLVFIEPEQQSNNNNNNTKLNDRPSRHAYCSVYGNQH